MPNTISVKLDKDENGKTTCNIRLELGLEATFKDGYYQNVGRRKAAKKFVDLACKVLVKGTRKQIEAALKDEELYFKLSDEEKEKIAADAFASGEKEDGTLTIPGSTDLLIDDRQGLFAPGGDGDTEVSGEDQKPDNGGSRILR